MFLESIHNKRAILVAQREQIMGQFNMTNGAIAVLDELIGEAALAESQRLATEQQLAQVAADMAREAAAAGNEVALAEILTEHAVTHPREVAPEMLPVIHDAPGTGDEPEAAEGRVWPAGDEPWLQDAPLAFRAPESDAA